MPERPIPSNLKTVLDELHERVRAVERQDFPQEPIPPETPHMSAYSWQSTFNLVAGYGHRLHADRGGQIVFLRAERSSGDGVSTATFDVEKNDVTLFPNGQFLTVPAGVKLGDQGVPDYIGRDKRKSWFKNGDSFRINVLTTGGGTGPLRVTIHFIPTVPHVAVPSRLQ